MNAISNNMKKSYISLIYSLITMFICVRVYVCVCVCVCVSVLTENKICMMSQTAPRNIGQLRCDLPLLILEKGDK